MKKIILVAVLLSLVGCDDIRPYKNNAQSFLPEVSVRRDELALELAEQRRQWAEKCMREKLVTGAVSGEMHRVCIKTSAEIYPDMINEQLNVEFKGNTHIK